MQIRKYRPSDCRELAELFYDTVHTVNAGDYTKEQLDAWATGHVDLEAWDRSFREHHTLVALEDGAVIGFGDIDGSGYLDRLYVHRRHQARAWQPPLRQAEQVCGRYQHPRIDYGEAFF
ncbi:MAG: GNAT family N-acetyltransferase [Ruthenibacterium lactatiformans]